MKINKRILIIIGFIVSLTLFITEILSQEQLDAFHYINLYLSVAGMIMFILFFISSFKNKKYR